MGGTEDSGAGAGMDCGVGSGQGRPQFIQDIQEGFAAAMVAGMPPPASSSQRFDPFDAAHSREDGDAASCGGKAGSSQFFTSKLWQIGVVRAQLCLSRPHGCVLANGSAWTAGHRRALSAAAYTSARLADRRSFGWRSTEAVSVAGGARSSTGCGCSL
jgi:hypothetical protein